MLIALSALSFCSIAPAADPPETKRVVVLYPESDGRPGNVLVDRGIRSAFQSYTAGPIEIYNEYLDLTRFSDERSQQLIAAFLREKYAGRKIDAVIPGLAHALDFTLKYRSQVFTDVPIVFCAVEQREVEARTLGPDVIGVPIWFDLAATLDVALRLHPKTQHVYVVAGAAEYDAAWEDEARRVFRSYEDQYEFVYLTGLTTPELLMRVAQLPEQSIVYYLNVFEDGAGRVVIPAEYVELLAAAANAPVYGYVDTFIGRGIVGGRPMSLEAAGLSAGRLAVRILAGESPATIGISAPSENAYQFDWRQLRRWGIDETSLPPGSLVHFKQPNFWNLYKWHALAVMALVIVQALLIVGLLVQWAKRWRADEDLRASYRRQRDLAGQLLTAQEGERRRIARELHDDLNQGLALLAVELDLLGQKLPPSPVQVSERLREMAARVKELSTTVHDLSHQLHPSKLEQLGLVAAVRSLCKEFTDGHSLRIEFTHREILHAIPEEVALCVYRIVQEALANVIKHSGARHVAVELANSANAVALRIADDGAGFDPQQVSSNGGLGLVNMRERLYLVNGEIVIDSKPAGGTRINVRIPLVDCQS